jgi:hypothetical protein
LVKAGGLCPGKEKKMTKEQKKIIEQVKKKKGKAASEKLKRALLLDNMKAEIWSFKRFVRDNIGNPKGVLWARIRLPYASRFFIDLDSEDITDGYRGLCGKCHNFTAPDRIIKKVTMKWLLKKLKGFL